MMKGATESGKSPNAGVRRAPGARRLPPPRLRAARRHREQQRRLDVDLRRHRGRVGLGRDHARVRRRRLRDRPLRRRAGRSRDVPHASCGAPPAWRKLYNRATGYLEPRYASGALQGRVRPARARRVRGGQRRAVHLDGAVRPGRPLRAARRTAEATARLDHHLDAAERGTAAPSTPSSATSRSSACRGSTTGSASPWKTQRVVREAATTLFDASPAGYVGQRRPRRDVGVVRLRRARVLSRRAGDGRPRAREPALPRGGRAPRRRRPDDRRDPRARPVRPAAARSNGPAVAPALARLGRRRVRGAARLRPRRDPQPAVGCRAAARPASSFGPQAQFPAPGSV